MVTDIATAGRHTTRGGHEVVVDPSPRTEAARFRRVPPDGKRGHASEIFRLPLPMCFSEYWLDPSLRSGADCWHFRFGERLFDTAGLGVMRDFPGLSDGDIAATARFITGHDRIGVVNGEGYGLKQPMVDTVASPEELNFLLARQARRAPADDRSDKLRTLEPFYKYGSDLQRRFE